MVISGGLNPMANMQGLIYGGLLYGAFFSSDISGGLYSVAYIQGAYIYLFIFLFIYLPLSSTLIKI